MGPLWIDIEEYFLQPEDIELLEHPTVGGVILFSRNYDSSDQLLELVRQVRSAARRPILIGVDQEGGRIQRFRDEFTPLPAAKRFAEYKNGEILAQQAGWLMAAELIAHDIDLSFAPVLDLGYSCRAIGDRAFGEDKETILSHSQAYMRGMKTVGMATTGKHFPGHGGVITDTHHETAIDERDSIFEQDMAIFKANIDAGVLDAMMPAHVIYPEYDSQPASGSPYWLKQVLREQLGFQGIVFSDDLSMEGAGVMGSPAERAMQSLEAGCDMLLMCNNRDYTVSALDKLPISTVPNATSLLKKQSFSLSELRISEEWKSASEAMKRMLDC